MKMKINNNNKYHQGASGNPGCEFLEGTSCLEAKLLRSMMENKKKGQKLK